MLKKYGKSKFSSKLGILRNSINKNSEKDFQKPKPSRTSIKKINFSIKSIDIRINTYYNIDMIRKGDTKDANES